MYMPFLAVTAAAVGLVQLGALSVWVTVFAAAIKALLAILLAVTATVGLTFLWRKYKQPE